MNRRGRILVIDDDANWREEVTEILQREGYHVDTAATYEEALERVNDVNYHVLVVDIRMKETDQTNEDGIKLLKELRERGSNEATQAIMLSAYGTRERTRRAFREYQVADFLYKEEFNKQLFLDSVREVFLEKVEINLALDIRWQEGTDPERAVHNLEVEGTRIKHGTSLHSQITAELEDLLCRLFHTARNILVRPLRSGKSGTGILRVQPFYATGGGGYEVVVKFGDSRPIEHEYDNFKQFVQPFLGSGHNTAIQEFRRTPRLGGIIYSLLDTSHDQLTEFGEFYYNSTSHQVCAVLDRLFQDTCGIWYTNRGDLQLLDLTADYQRLLSESLDAFEQIRFTQLTTVSGQHKLYFTSLTHNRPRPFTNPMLAMAEKTLVRPTYIC
jgi:CheY-like chemotaxis protein